MSEQTPRLQKPGAPLPLPQRLILRYFVGPVLSKQGTPAEHRARYERITSKILDLIAQVPLEKRSMRVLVPSQRGLEDSSRYWSLNEVMEHLLIVSRSIEGVILSLSHGVVPNGKADTAAVKPSQATRDFYSEFKDYAPDLVSRIDEKLKQTGGTLDSPTLFAHPWFGEISARQWYWLLGQHQSIHYVQTKNIVRGLSAKN